MMFSPTKYSPVLYRPAPRTGCYCLAERSRGQLTKSHAVRRALSLDACDIVEPVSELPTQSPTALALPKMTQSSLFGNLRSRWSLSPSPSIASSPSTSSSSLSSQAYEGSFMGLASINGRFTGPAPVLTSLRLDAMAVDDYDSIHFSSWSAVEKNAGLGLGLEIGLTDWEEFDISPSMPSLIFSPPAPTLMTSTQHSQTSPTQAQNGSHIFATISQDGSSVDSISLATPFNLECSTPATGFAASTTAEPSNFGPGFLIPSFQSPIKAPEPAPALLSRSAFSASSSQRSPEDSGPAPCGRASRKRKASFFLGHSPHIEGTGTETEEVITTKTLVDRPSKLAKHSTQLIPTATQQTIKIDIDNFVFDTDEG